MSSTSGLIYPGVDTRTVALDCNQGLNLATGLDRTRAGHFDDREIMTKIDAFPSEVGPKSVVIAFRATCGSIMLVHCLLNTITIEREELK